MTKTIRRHLLFLLHLQLLLLAGVMMLAVSPAHASTNKHQQCVLYADQKDNRLHLHVPICFYNNGDVYTESFDRYLAFNGRKAGATHPAAPCAEIIEGVERVDPTTFLVRLYCPSATPAHDAVSVEQAAGQRI
jgi:hypothetical protein